MAQFVWKVLGCSSEGMSIIFQQHYKILALCLIGSVDCLNGIDSLT